MPALREVLSHFGITVDDKQVAKADKKIGDFTSTIQKAGQAIGAYFVARGLVQMTTATLEAGDRIDKLSKKIGINAEALQEWEHAAALSGVGAEKLSMAVGMIQKNAEAAGSGNKEFAKTFKALGVNVKDSSGHLKGADALMMEVADGIAGVENDTKRTAIAMKLFGESGKDLIPLFAGGSAGVAKMRGELRELGGVMSQEMIDQTVEATDNLTRFEKAFEGVRNAIMIHVLPVLNDGIEILTKWVKMLRESPRAIALFKTALIGLGVVAAASAAKILIAYGPVIAHFAIIAAAVGLAVLVVEDFITALNGGDSVLADWAKMFDEWISKIPLLKELAEIGHSIGDLFGADTAEKDLKDQEQRDQFLVEARARQKALAAGPGTADRTKTKVKRTALPTAVARLPQVNQGGVVQKTQNNNSASTVNNQLNATLNVKAEGASPREVMDMVKREGGKLIEGMLTNAQAATPGAR